MEIFTIYVFAFEILALVSDGRPGRSGLRCKEGGCLRREL